MAENISWEWLIKGFKIDLETQLKPKTVKDYCDHGSYFARWAQGNNKSDPRSITKRDIQEFLHFVAYQCGRHQESSQASGEEEVQDGILFQR